jgi:hypothetical protein
MAKSHMGIDQVSKKNIIFFFFFLNPPKHINKYLRFLFLSITILTSAMKWLLESLVDGDIRYLDTDIPGNPTLYDS